VRWGTPVRMSEVQAGGAEGSAAAAHTVVSPIANPGEGARLWRGALIVAVLAVVALWLVAGYFDPGRLHIRGMSSRLNDQAGYITTARILADTGELRSGLVMPAFADNPASRVYMPGHYALLALSYKLFGYSVWTSLLPNLLAFVVAAVAVFLIGARRYGPLAGGAASIFMILFPPNLLFAFTAMAEGTFLAVGILGFGVFTCLGERGRLLAAPFLVGSSFLFRETGALWVVPLGLMMLFEARSWGRRRAILLVVATVGVVFALNRWQLASGKEAPPLTWLMGSRFNYGDAQAVATAQNALAPDQLPGLVLTNVARNFENLIDKVLAAPGQFEGSSVLVMLTVLVATVLVGLVRIRRDSLPLGAAGMALATWALAFGLYDVVGLKLLRSSMFFMPICAVALAGTACRAFGAPQRAGRAAFSVLAVIVLTAWLGWTVPICRQAGIEVTAGDAEADRTLETVEQIGHDETKLLVAPWLLGLEYSVAHYPVRYSFPIENLAGLSLLDQQIPIGTLILPRGKLADFPPADLRRVGLVRSGRIDGGGGAASYLVFQVAR